MELNFNSVEMSRKPNAESSPLGYAEVPLTFNSVETIANLNASAAFFSPSLEQLKGQVDSGKVFKEDTDIVPVIVDDTLSYMPWGGGSLFRGKWYNIKQFIGTTKEAKLITHSSRLKAHKLNAHSSYMGIKKARLSRVGL